jgi:hypothetical protein
MTVKIGDMVLVETSHYGMAWFAVVEVANEDGEFFACDQDGDTSCFLLEEIDQKIEA